MLVPKGLTPSVPFCCRSDRKFVRNDCNAAVDGFEADVLLAVPPPKAPINVWNAELRFDSTLDDRPEVEVLPLST
jgi:hypothetical protein